MSIYLGSFIFQIIAFAILFLLLKKYAFGPLLGVMQKRQEQIQSQITGAEKDRTEAEKLLKEQQAELKKASLEAQQIIENAKASSVKQANEIVEKARVEAERLKDQSLQEIKLEKEKAIKELREQVATLSVMIASKVIEKEIDAKTQSKMIDDIMKQVGESI